MFLVRGQSDLHVDLARLFLAVIHAANAANRNSSTGYGHWSDCRAPDWKWRIWPLIGLILCTGMAVVIVIRLYQLRNGPIPATDVDPCCRFLAVVAMLVGPALALVPLLL